MRKTWKKSRNSRVGAVTGIPDRVLFRTKAGTIKTEEDTCGVPPRCRFTFYDDVLP